MPEVIRTVQIAATPDRVWKWFASQDVLRQWWAAHDLVIDLTVGGVFSLTGVDGTTRVSGHVLELEPERRLVLSWLETDNWAHPARLLFTLEPTEGGTLVTLQHDGFAGIGTTTWQRTRDAYERGADAHSMLPRLAALISTQRDTEPA